MKNHPNETVAVIEESFHDAWAASIDLDHLDVYAAFTAETTPEFRYAIQSLGDIKGKHVLDLGCGPGESSVFLARRGARVSAIDISSGMVQVAQELARRFETPQNQLQIFKMSAETLEFPADNFDLVFGSNVLHHCNLDTVSREIARVLKPGGRAVFIEPLGYNPIIELYRRMAFKVRTPTEHPLVYRDIQTIAENFKSVSHKEFHFLTLAIFLWFFIGEGIHPNEARYWRKFVLESNRYARAFRKLHALDNFLLDNFPLLKRLCWVIVATFDK